VKRGTRLCNPSRTNRSFRIKVITKKPRQGTAWGDQRRAKQWLGKVADKPLRKKRSSPASIKRIVVQILLCSSFFNVARYKQRNDRGTRTTTRTSLQKIRGRHPRVTGQKEKKKELNTYGGIGERGTKGSKGNEKTRQLGKLGEWCQNCVGGKEALMGDLGFRHPPRRNSTSIWHRVA